MATPDEDLNQLEADVRRLKIEYEQYFGGGRARPPSDTQWRVELIVKRYSDRGSDMNFAQRFRYNTLAMTYAKYREMWNKKLKQKEEGAGPHAFGGAAKAARPGAKATGAQGESEFVMVCSDPSREAGKVDELYRALLLARQNAQEKSAAPELNAFRQFIEKKTTELKQQMGADRVEYSVALENGQVRLKAKALE